MKERVEELSGEELKAIHEELKAADVPPAEIVLAAKVSTSTLYKIYRDEYVRPNIRGRAVAGLLALRDRKLRASA